MVEASLLMKQATRDQLEDRDFAIAVVSLWGLFIKDLSVKFRDDTEIMLLAISNGASLKSASHRLRSDKKFVFSIVKNSGDDLEWASTSIQIDKEVVLAAVTSSCHALQWASSKLRDDEEVVLAAIGQYSSGIRFASNRLQNDKVFISSALNLSSYVFDGIPVALQCDKEFILLQLLNTSCNYYRIPKIFANDREVVTSALRVRGENYLDIAEEFQADKNLFFLALKNCRDITSTLILHAPKSLQCNREVVLTAVRANWLNLQWVQDEFKDDEEIVFLAISIDMEQQQIEFQAMEFASSRLKDDKNFVRKAVSINWICFDEVSERLKNDSSFVTELCKVNKSISQLSNLVNHDYAQVSDVRRFPSRSSSIHNNPFWILGVSPCDTRQIIIQRSEEQSLHGDPETCQKSRSDLTNPRSRIAAEVSWFPGLSPSMSIKIMDDLIENPLMAAKLTGLPTLARANVLAAALELAELTTSSEKQIASLMQLLANVVDTFDSGEILRYINEDRMVAGFPDIQDITSVQVEIDISKKRYRTVLKNALNGLPSLVLIETMTLLVNESTGSGEHAGHTLINDLVDTYEIETQSVLLREKNNICILVKNILSSVDSDQNFLNLTVDKLETAIINWSRISIPIQVNMKARGLDHDSSLHIAYEIRNTALTLYNEHNLIDAAQRITNLLVVHFSNVPIIAEKSKIDAEALVSIKNRATKGMDSGAQNEQRVQPKAPQASSTNDNKKNDDKARPSSSYFDRWKELTPEQKAASAAKQPPIRYQTAIGRVQLFFDDKKIKYGELILPISGITGLRWGHVGSSRSIDSSKFVIFFSNSGIGDIVIEWESKDDVDGDKFKMITYWLTKLVAPKLIEEMQIQFYRGETISIGKLKCRKDGVIFVITGFFGAKDHVCPWNRIGTEINDGVIHIFDTTNQKARFALSLSEVENAFVLHNFPMK